VVSLIGPGGIGKSRLALEVARADEDLFPDGTYFVPLEGVLEGDLLLPTIAFTLGVRDNGEAALEERILRALANRRVLVVLDNFEQIVDAAPALVRLYTSALSARFLVTSRMVLRIRGEQVYEVPPLAVSEAAVTLERVLQSPACVLFADRARAVRPDFRLTKENARDVADICRRLEGLPLAIELAAAKVRMMTPRGIAERLEHSLQMLTTGGRDLPERQHTMRATIDWSVSLLSPTHRDLLADLGVFGTRFTMDAVEAIGAGRAWGKYTMEGIAALVDGSLVKQTDVDGYPVFSLLAVVREYALGQLEDRGDAERMQAAHADYYSALVRRVAPGLRGDAQVEAIAQLGFELSNLRAAVRHLMYTDRLDDAGDFAWDLLIYWWIMGFLAEVRVWMLELLAKEEPITPHTRAVAWFLTLWGQMWQNPTAEVVAGLGECVRLFTNSGDEDAAAMAVAARATARAQLPDPDLDTAEEELRDARTRLKHLGNSWAEAISEVSLGRMSWLRGALDEAMEHFERATEIATLGGDLFTKSVASNQKGRLLLLREESDAAEQVFRGTMLDSIRVHHDGGVAYSLEGFAGVAAQRGDARRAGTLAAVARSIRHRIGMFDVDAFTVHTAFIDRLRKTEPDAVGAGERRGAELSLAEAVALALPKADRALADTVLAHW
jgi:predicted ATPase